MTTAWQAYHLPIEQMNALDKNDEASTWDGCLNDREMAEEALQVELQKTGSALNIWAMGYENRWRMLDLLTATQSYPLAVEQFLAEQQEEATQCQ